LKILSGFKKSKVGWIASFFANKAFSADGFHIANQRNRTTFIEESSHLLENHKSHEYGFE
jgi:hypothetical protein